MVCGLWLFKSHHAVDVYNNLDLFWINIIYLEPRTQTVVFNKHASDKREKNSKGEYLDLGIEQIPKATPILYVKYHLRYFEKNISKLLDFTFSEYLFS